MALGITEVETVVHAPTEAIARLEAGDHLTRVEFDSKLHVYRRQGVREYLVLRIRDAEIDWFELVDGQYVPLARDDSGLVKSRVFPGLWLDVPAMLCGDLARALARLQEGIGSRSMRHSWPR